ncbi:MAG: glycoside hydrolase family 16 protein [Spirochaetales bacterium]|nr:glycoside hydrolase family 16 protein [Spirochaetales bacterium]
MHSIGKLIWQDEFDYSGLPNPDKWVYDVFPPGRVNNELQAYTKERLENVRVEDGRLIIEARRDGFDGNEYTSARIKTSGLGDWAYGRFEVMAKLPRGRGTWPAIWMLSSEKRYGKWPASGEIDIMEHVGYRPGVVQSSVHYFTRNFMNNEFKTKTYDLPDCMDNFHLYACEWYPDRLDFFVDTVKIYSYSNPGTGWQQWPFDHSFHLILNIAVGGHWGGKHGVDPDIWPQRMEVQYVRVYDSGNHR